MSKNSYVFKVSGKMARLLGRESVSSDTAAIFELIKNAYDADAESVQIIFKDILKNNGKNAKIIIKDNGHGMDIDSINNKWMVIGTDDKEETQLSRTKKRIFIGNKGIGRFATEKLCKKVTMISKPDTMKKILSLTINWEEYEKKNITFNDVKIPLQTHERENIDDVGLELVLEGLRESWPKKKILELYETIRSIILPKELISKNDTFNISIIAKEFPDLEHVVVKSSLLKYAPYELIAKINNNHDTNAKFIIKKEGKIVETKNFDFNDVKIKYGEAWNNFGKCKLMIYIFPGTSKYESWNDYYKISKIGHVRQILKKIHGVKIYRDGFWVRPYGDIDNDWLNLEGERVQANLKIGNSQIVGFVIISKKDNPMIEDTTTRERLVENNAYYSMQRFVKQAMEIMYQYKRRIQKEYEENEPKIQHENLINSDLKKISFNINESKMNSEVKKDTISMISSITKTFKKYKKLSEDNMDELETRERFNRNLASLGISTAATSHELRPIIGNLGSTSKTIIDNLKKDKKIWKLYEQSAVSLNSNIVAIHHYVQFILHFIRHISDEDKEKPKKRIINIVDELDKFSTGIDSLMKQQHINITVNVHPKNLTIYMYGADFLSIILNLYSNSLKSFEQKKKTDKTFRREIIIDVTEENKNFNMKFIDNGMGIKPSNKDIIFEALHTTYDEGTGLGLTILRDLLHEYSGTIEVADKNESNIGATFIISIPMINLEK